MDNLPYNHSKSYAADIFKHSMSRKAQTQKLQALPPMDPPSASSHREYGIMQFDPETCDSPPVFTERITLEAMEKNGITPNDLVRLSRDSLRKIPGNPAMKDKIVQELESRRLQAIEAVKKTRNELASQGNRGNAFSRTMERSLKGDAPIRKEERLQQRGLEQVIVLEFQQRMAREAEMQRQRQSEEVQQKLKEEARRKQEEEARRRREKEQRVSEKLRQKEEDLEERKRKRDEEDERWRQMEVEAAEKRKADTKKLLQDRAYQAKKFQEEKDRKKAEFQQKREEETAEFVRKDEERMRARQAEMEQTRRQRQAILEKQFEQYTATKKREQENMEKKATKVEEGERALQLRMNEFQRKREGLVSQMKMRNNDKIARSKTALEKISLAEMERRKAIELKTRHSAEHLEQMLREKQRRTELLIQKDAKSHSIVRDRLARSQELFNQKIDNDKKRFEANDARVVAMRQRVKEETENKAAEQWLKLRIGEDNAKRLERIRQWEQVQKVKRIEERSKSADQFDQQKRMEAENYKKMSRLASARKEKAIVEFQRLLANGGEPNLQELADKFGLDYEMLNRRIMTAKGPVRA